MLPCLSSASVPRAFAPPMQGERSCEVHRIVRSDGGVSGIEFVGDPSSASHLLQVIFCKSGAACRKVLIVADGPDHFFCGEECLRDVQQSTHHHPATRGDNFMSSYPG